MITTSRVASLVLAAAVSLTSLGLSLATTAAAQEFRQIELNDKLVEAFIAAQKDYTPLSSKLIEGGEKPDDALMKQLEDIAKKHGFASFAEFEDVGTNITIVLDGLDRTSGAYTDPVEKMKKELEEIKADETIPAEDKKLAVDDLEQEIAMAQPLKYEKNIEVVKKHLPAIEALIPEDLGESEMSDEPPAP